MRPWNRYRRGDDGFHGAGGDIAQRQLSGVCEREYAGRRTGHPAHRVAGVGQRHRTAVRDDNTGGDRPAGLGDRAGRIQAQPDCDAGEIDGAVDSHRCRRRRRGGGARRHVGEAADVQRAAIGMNHRQERRAYDQSVGPQQACIDGGERCQFHRSAGRRDRAARDLVDIVIGDQRDASAGPRGDCGRHVGAVAGEAERQNAAGSRNLEKQIVGTQGAANHHINGADHG